MVDRVPLLDVTLALLLVDLEGAARRLAEVAPQRARRQQPIAREGAVLDKCAIMSGTCFRILRIEFNALISGC